MNRRYTLYRTVLLVVVGLLAGCRSQEPPYSPQEALQTFQLPPGFRIELVAAEPQIADPVSMAFDERGRLYVVEMGSYPISDQRLSRVKVLEDRDGDGFFESASLFAEGLSFAHGVTPWKGGVLVASAPDILYFADRDGDGRAEVREVVLSGFAQVNPQLRINSLQFEMDNWIYGAYPRFGIGLRFKQFSDQGRPIHFPAHPEVPAVDSFSKGMDIRFRPDPPQLEAVSGNSEYGLAFNERGHRFVSWNDKHIRHVVVEAGYLDRNPYLAAGAVVESVPDHGDSSPVFPITQNPHLKEIRRDNVMKELGHFTSACGQSIYHGGLFPEPYEGAYFICEPVHNLVHVDLLEPAGPTYTARRHLPDREFLASTDSWFMPVSTSGGPDGALYVVDFYRKIVEHPEWIHDNYVNDQELFYAGSDRGRIYRIVPEETAPESPSGDLAGAATETLVESLAHPNRWRRLTAQRLLLEKQDPAAPELLRTMLAAPAAARAAVHALWTLHGLKALQPDEILKALRHPEAAVREQAVRLSEDFLTDPALASALPSMTGDADPRVRFQLACSLGGLPAAQSFPALLEIARRESDNRWFHLAVLSSAGETAPRWLKTLLSDQTFLARKSETHQSFFKLAGSVVGARQQEAEIRGALEQVAVQAGANENNWWQSAALSGLAQGLARGKEPRLGLSARTQEVLLRLVETSPPAVQTSALEVASQISLAATPQMNRLLAAARSDAADPKAPAEQRVRAVRVLALDPSSPDGPLLERLISPQEPEEVQMAAARTLIGRGDSASIEAVLSRWKGLTPPLREDVLQGLFLGVSGQRALLQAVEQEIVPAWSISPVRRRQLLRASDSEIRRRAEALLPEGSPDRKDVLERYRPALQIQGNRTRGAEIFAAECGRCHRAGGTGTEVGPDLAAVSGRSKEELLKNILDPNENLVPGYEEYLVETADGRMMTGIIKHQDSSSLTLRRSGGEEVTVARNNIAVLRSLAVSAMPEGLEAEWTVEEAADLLEFLTSLGNR